LKNQSNPIHWPILYHYQIGLVSSLLLEVAWLFLVVVDITRTTDSFILSHRKLVSEILDSHWDSFTTAV
jgi:hypothetical protein